MKRLLLLLTSILFSNLIFAAPAVNKYDELLASAKTGGDAVKLCQKAIDTDPQRAQAYFELAKAYIKAGDEGAQEAGLLEQVVFEAGVDEKALKNKKKTLSVKKAALTVAAYYLLKSKIAEAAQMIDSAEKYAPDTKAIFCFKGILEGKKDNWEEAKKLALLYRAFDDASSENNRTIKYADMPVTQRKGALMTFEDGEKPEATPAVNPNDENTKQQALMKSLQAKTELAASDAKEQKESMDEGDMARKKQMKDYIDRESKELEKMRIEAGDDKDKLKEYAKRMKKLREDTMEFTGGRR